MPDYPMPPTSASTPDFDLDASLDAAHIADLLATLERIPRDELRDGAARNDLARVIRDGLIDNLYRPMGCDWHNIAWAHRPAWEDPRQRLSEWLDEWGAWVEAIDIEEEAAADE